MAIRKHGFHRPLARTLAEPTAGNDRFRRGIHLEVVALPRDEPVDAASDMRKQRVGARDTAKRQGTERDNPKPRHPTDKEHQSPHRQCQHGLAKVWLCQQQHCHQHHQNGREQIARDLATLASLREQPGANHDESGLHELGRLHREPRHGDPAARTLHLHADRERKHHRDQREEEHHQCDAAHHTRRTVGDRDHHNYGKHREHRMATREVERVQADALGDRRARGERHDHADADQRHQRYEQTAIDRPPPLGYRAAMRA